MLHATKMAVSKCPCLTLSNVMFRRQNLRVIGFYKHQLIVPSTLLAPATDIRAHKDTKPQRYMRLNHCHVRYFFKIAQSFHYNIFIQFQFILNETQPVFLFDVI